jgi:hypothetical protein
MDALKNDKKDALAVIAYHVTQNFYISASYDRFKFYGGTGTPLSVFDGTSQLLGGYPDAYQRFLTLYNQAAAVTPAVDISLVPDGSSQVHVEVTNTSWSALQGTLHIVLVERHRPYVWRDMNVLDFICRTMMPGANGQSVSIAPSQTFSSVQQFSLNPDWNYCSIVAFVQTSDKKILQGAVIDLEDTIPKIEMRDVPATGALWLKGSTHSFSWSSSRSLPSVVYEYSSNGGSTWTEFQPQNTSGKIYSWTLPDINSNRCLLSVRDPFGGARAVSGLFAIGTSGDFNNDGKVDAADRAVLVEYLTENRTALIPGADLNGDGLVDLFDLIYFDANLGK